MLTITSAQMGAWVMAFMFPLTRILALLATAPIFNNASISARPRLIIGVAFSLALAPNLPPLPPIEAGSWLAGGILLQEILIGTLIGFSLRLAFSAIDIAGEMIGMQMGLSFAVIYDPQSAGQTPVITNFLSLLTTLIFLASNGHLLILSLLAESFTILPISTTPLMANSLGTVVASASVLFSLGLLLSLPIIAALLIANIGLGVLARVAPQLNLFAIGFIVTIVAGFVVLMIALPYIGVALEKLFELAFLNMDHFLQAAKPR